MTDPIARTPLPSPGSPLAEAMGDDAHFADALANLGEAMPLVTSEAIYDRDGAKVLDAGHRIDRAIYQRIAGRILAKPLADTVSAQDLVDGSSLLEEALFAIGSEPFYKALASFGGELESISETLSRLALPRQAALRLTMAKSVAPALFGSCVRQGILCSHFARRLGWPRARVELAMIAGLCLDLGMLHVDPALTSARRRLANNERRHVFAHPLIGMVCAMEAGLPPEASEAIAQHHERLDGSGYPSGVAADSIPMLSRIAQISACAEGMLSRSKGSQCEALHLALRLNADQFDPALSQMLMAPVAIAMESQAKPAPAAAEGPSDAPVLAAIARIAQVFALADLWNDSIDSAIEAGAPKEMIEPLFEMELRMHQLSRSLIRAGIFPSQMSTLSETGCPSEEEASELFRIASEAIFQLCTIGANMARRWPFIAQDPCFIKANDCLASMESLGSY